MVGGVLVDIIGGVVSGTRGGGLQLVQSLMDGGKKSLEMGPGIIGWLLLFLQLAIVIEHSSLENQLICDANNFQRDVWGIPGHGILYGAFDLID